MKNNISTPCLAAAAGKTQTSATCDLIKNLPGIRETLCSVSTGKRGTEERERDRGWGKSWIWRGEADKEQADMNGLLTTLAQGYVWAWAITKGQVSIWGPEAANGPVLMFVVPVTLIDL